ncbi:hypothetical protein NX722_16680 [Endozoicomonas gorgoniicola]|uniref:DUF4124 domain-containing protein n=1 Tax=Endozoicomonas gorgoniicola TaxID=1234144 RepID=A0ABT3MXW9_9GAMM|nr:hypothetical protein [Endozoicomonas gorgoniicola]MCW7554225.1 hypothetical protein [Endozoicomonas gorgoniicola]
MNRARYFTKRPVSIVVALMGCLCITAVSADDIAVYKPDGSVQCSDEPGRSQESDRRQLKSKGVRVSDQFRAKLPPAEQQCGKPTGMANGFVIRGIDLKKAKKLGFEVMDY